jgi:uncharacterized RDD family membrane protein YckC
MGEEYYILEDGEKKGPFTFKELVNQELDLDTKVRAPGSDEWQSASYLPQFSEYFASLGYMFPTEDNLAPIAYRVLSYIIDYMIIGIIAAIIIVKIGLINVTDANKLSAEQMMNSISMRTQLTMEVIFAILFIIYNILSEIGSLRGSIGKRIFGLRVVDADGKSLPILKSFVRSIGAVTGYSPLGLVIIIISYFIGKHRQTWYERVTDSFVIRPL